MTPLRKGLLLMVLQGALVLSLGGKLLLDRATRPRVWVRARPVDPDLPLRGRYVRLRLDATSLPEGQRPGITGDALAYFLPEHVPDPSLRPTGEELWVEVTLPRRGPPRPIRLAVKGPAGFRVLPY